MSGKVKWGVLGTAGIARGCTIPGMKLADNCELYAVAGRNYDKAVEFQKEFGFEKAYGSYDELLADPEVKAVYIPLPNDLHYEWSLKAMQAGKNVLCEKPLAPTKEMAEKLFAAAKECGVVLMEAFAYLHSPFVDAVKSELDAGTIGDVKYIESAFIVQGCKPTDIRMHRANYGGSVYDLGCYSTSMILWMLGKLPNEVLGCAEFTDDKIDLHSSAIMKFDNEVRASLNCGMVFGNSRNGRYDRLYINGSKGCIKSYAEFNGSGELEYTVFTDEGATVKKVDCRQNYCLEVEQLGRCILNGEKPRVSPEFSVMNAELINNILTAIGYN